MAQATTTQPTATNIEFLPFPKAEYDRAREKYTRILKGEKRAIVRIAWGGEEGLPWDQPKELEDESYNLAYNAQGYNNMVRAVSEGYDNLPNVKFDFGGVAYLIALAYGGGLLKVDYLINAHHVYESVEEAKAFTRIENIQEHGLFPIITKRIKRFQQAHPEIPVGISDNQSPIDVLTSLVKSDAAMIGMFTDPDVIHNILSGITDSIIEVNRHLERVIENFSGFGTAVLPFGMHVSDDNVAFLSPETYRDFAVPYTERLSEEFGGIDYHCCMGYKQNLATMANTKGFLAFDPQTDYNPLEMVIDAVANKGVWHLNTYPWQQIAGRSETNEETLMNAIAAAEGKCGLDILVYEDTFEKTLRTAERVRDELRTRDMLAE